MSSTFSHLGTWTSQRFYSIPSLTLLQASLHTKPPASTREKRIITELFRDGGCRSDSHIYTQHYNFMLSVFEQPEAGTGRALSSLKHPLNRAFVDAELECSPSMNPRWLCMNACSRSLVLSSVTSFCCFICQKQILFQETYYGFC